VTSVAACSASAVDVAAAAELVSATTTLNVAWTPTLVLPSSLCRLLSPTAAAAAATDSASATADDVLVDLTEMLGTLAKTTPRVLAMATRMQYWMTGVTSTMSSPLIAKPTDCVNDDFALESVNGLAVVGDRVGKGVGGVVGLGEKLGRDVG